LKANEVSEDNEGHVDFLENPARQNDGCCRFFWRVKPDRMMSAVVFCSNEGNEDNEDNAVRQNDGMPRFRKMK